MWRSTIVAVLAAASAPTSICALPITLDFTGTVFTYQVFDHSEDPVESIGLLSDLNAHGSLTYDPDAGPAPTFIDFADGIYEQRSLGSPPTEFVSGSASWALGTFAPAPLPPPPGAIEGGDLLQLLGLSFNPDELLLADIFTWASGDDSWGEALILSLRDDFIANGSPPTGSELPNLATATGLLVLQSVSWTRGATSLYDGFQVGVELSSVTRRAAQVPEPGTLVLLLAGLFGLARMKRNAGHA